MAILPIKTFPDPILKQKTKKIEESEIKNPEMKELVLDMFDTLKANNGLGLAATQIGKSLKLCVLKFDGKSFVLFNPKIKSKSWMKEIAEEGCLSFPGIFIPVKRSKKVKVEALDKNGEKIFLKAEGLFARALQHEIDHLEGILFIEKECKPKKSKIKK